MNVNSEIERLEYTLAMVSIDHGHGKNPCELDVPLMERSVVLLRAYRDLLPQNSDLDAVMARVANTEFGNLAETDPAIAAIRRDIMENLS